MEKGFCHVVIEQVPNRVTMARESLNKQHLFKFKVQRRDDRIYHAAAQIWARGISWPEALAMVQGAFDATTFES